MIIIALLLVALALLIAGLVLASAPLLIGSLVASVIAGALVLRMRASFGARKTSPARSGPPAVQTHESPASSTATDETPSTVSSPVVATDPLVWVIDGRPRYHRSECEIVEGADPESIPHSQAIEDGFIACSLCQPDVVRTT